MSSTSLPVLTPSDFAGGWGDSAFHSPQITPIYSCNVCKDLDYRIECVENFAAYRQRLNEFHGMVDNPAGNLRQDESGKIRLPRILDWKPPYPADRVWFESSSEGCQGCTLGVQLYANTVIEFFAKKGLSDSAIRKKILDTISTEAIHIVYWRGRNGCLMLQVANVKASDTEELVTRYLIYNVPSNYFLKPFDSLPFLTTDRFISKSPIDLFAMRGIRRWLDECRSNHHNCHSQPHFLPTRLIKLYGPDITEDFESGPEIVTRAHLVEPKNLVAFAALSYCWGTKSDDWLLTTIESYDLHCLHINIKKLPATIHQAFAVARFLGFDYLWVDSLCIIQNNDEDWRKEARNMGELYASADLVLAADSLPDCTMGFCNDQLLESTQSVVNLQAIRIFLKGLSYLTMSTLLAIESGQAVLSGVRRVRKRAAKAFSSVTSSMLHPGSRDNQRQDICENVEEVPEDLSIGRNFNSSATPNEQGPGHGSTPENSRLREHSTEHRHNEGTNKCYFSPSDELVLNLAFVFPKKAFVAIREETRSHRGVNNISPPLHSRAWTAQEILLARRVINFGLLETSWFCMEQSACQCEGYHSTNRLNHDNTLRGLLSKIKEVASSEPHPHFQETVESIHVAWKYVLVSYTRRDMTFHRDKLIALSGIAKIFSTALKKVNGVEDIYLAGHWGSNFAESLLWTFAPPVESKHIDTAIKRSVLSIDLREHQNYDYREQLTESNAPSWSWASKRAPLTYISPVTDQGFAAQSLESEPFSPHLELLDSFVATIDRGDNFGFIHSVRVRVRAKISEVQCGFFAPLSPEEVEPLGLLQEALWYRFNLTTLFGDLKNTGISPFYFVKSDAGYLYPFAPSQILDRNLSPGPSTAVKCFLRQNLKRARCYDSDCECKKGLSAKRFYCMDVGFSRNKNKIRWCWLVLRQSETLGVYERVGIGAAEFLKHDASYFELFHSTEKVDLELV